MKTTKENIQQIAFRWSESWRKGSFLDISQLFTLTIDANVACGTILMQEADDGKKKIIVVASHTFITTEQNWSTTERGEAYAIKWAIAKFDHVLRNQPFVIFTDHRLLTFLDQREFNNSKIRRWEEDIFCYKFILEFIEEESNIWAEMLSRGCGHKKVKTPNVPTPAGRTFKLESSNLHIYVPSSWRGWQMTAYLQSTHIPKHPLLQVYPFSAHHFF